MFNLPSEYSGKPVTPFGGMSLMKRFIDQVWERSYLEAQRLYYIIAVRMYPNVNKRSLGTHGLGKPFQRNCVERDGFQLWKWQTRTLYHYQKAGNPETPVSRNKLFDDQAAYRYSCYVTSLRLPPDQVWSIYNSGADCESRTKELKNDFGLENFSCRTSGLPKHPSGSL